MKYRSTILYVLVLYSLFSCSIKPHQIRKISSFHYATDFIDSTKWLAGIDVYSYQKNPKWEDDIQFDKSLFYSKDSSECEMEFRYYNLSGEGEFLEMGLKRSDEINDESLNIYHTYFDSTENSWFEIQYEKSNSSDLPQLCSLEIQCSSDSLEYTRILTPSKELINHYKKFAYLCADSIEFADKISKPDFSSCTELVSSTYEITECLSKEDDYYRITWVDSSFVGGELKVEKEMTNYYYSEVMNELGLRVIKERNSEASYYIEKHIERDNHFPVYQRDIRINPISNDTIYQMEMKSSPIGNNRMYSYIVIGKSLFGEFPDEFGNPITRREVKIWTNKFGQIVQFHSICFTEKGNRLEYAFEGLPEKRKVTIDNRVIPESSGKHYYKLYVDDEIDGQWLYFKPKRKGRNTKPAKNGRIVEIPFDFKYNSKITERNRRENYEKWISPDSLSIYNVYYYKK